MKKLNSCFLIFLLIFSILPQEIFAQTHTANEEIEKLEKAQADLQLKMNDADFYQQPHETINQLLAEFAKNEEALLAAYQRWETLEELNKKP